MSENSPDELILMRRTQLNKILRERDEARRECCLWMAEVEGATPEEHAREQGWDCFKEKP